MRTNKSRYLSRELNKIRESMVVESLDESMSKKNECSESYGRWMHDNDDDDEEEEEAEEAEETEEDLTVYKND
ncbi:hypothetical protein DPMN_030060 [Dreissena polymorpha]|uniref:Uncharacterized protein n=1 Tax=Dreissena polymorpha TaxID=45954 RepID=A0A9D4M0D9_DREPO|nr:hypothetical protein DPMN_030060 [Dreissena polymorpha]